MNGSIPHKGNPDYDHYDPLEVLYMTVIVIINSLHGSWVNPNEFLQKR